MTAVQTHSPKWEIPALDRENAAISGTAAGLAAEIGVRPLWVRAAFVALFAVGGWGALYYMAAWGLLRWAEFEPSIHPPPPDARQPKGRTPFERIIGLGFVTVGLIVLSANFVGLPASFSWPLGIIGVGFAVAWKEGTGAQRSVSPAKRRLRPLLGGISLVVGGTAILLFSQLDFSTPAFVIVSIIVVLSGTVVVSGPWLWQTLGDLDSERQARARSDERAEVAAHLHDSVLQTLALIQKGGDPQTMVNLARRQERELRNWLDPDRASRQGGSVRGHLDDLATDVEELHGVPVEVVAVGDCLVDEGIGSLLKAAREAAVNAARHSGADRVDIFVEITPDAVDLFIRDTGKGFDPSVIDRDRRGVKESIIGRMERAGGTATIISQPSEGTEVELRIPRSDPSSQK